MDNYVEVVGNHIQKHPSTKQQQQKQYQQQHYMQQQEHHKPGVIHRSNQHQQLSLASHALQQPQQPLAYPCEAVAMEDSSQGALRMTIVCDSLKQRKQQSAFTRKIFGDKMLPAKSENLASDLIPKTTGDLGGESLNNGEYGAGRGNRVRQPTPTPQMINADGLSEAECDRDTSGTLTRKHRHKNRNFSIAV